MIRRTGAVVLGIGLCLQAVTADGHAFGARYDLPLPLAFYLSAAGLAVAISFATAAFFLRSPSPRRVRLRVTVPTPVVRLTQLVLAILGLLFWALIVATALLGPPEVTRNFATIFVWVIWWVGYLLISGLAVQTWPAIDPFRRLSWSLRNALRTGWARAPRSLPVFAGLIAPVGLLCLAWIELVSDYRDDPRSLGVLILTYTMLTIVMAFVFGPIWFRVADPLGRLFELLGRLAVLRPHRRGLTVSLPGESLAAPRRVRVGEPALVCVLIGVVLFDGLSETPAWEDVLNAISSSQAMRPGLLFLREQGVDLLKLIQTVGLISTVCLTMAVYYAMSFVARRVANGDMNTFQVAAAFAGALLPIAVAYHLSHYTSYLLIAGQLLIPAASDPFAAGWDLFGGAGHVLDIGIIGAEQVWWIAFVALIAGHSLSVLIGHRLALRLYQDPRDALRSQIPMTVGMVGLTVLSLWILSQPIIA